MPRLATSAGWTCSPEELTELENICSVKVQSCLQNVLNWIAH